MYFFYRQGIIPPLPSFEEGIKIIKCTPHSIVSGMHSMQIGKKKWFYFQLMSFLFRGFQRVFKEYDIIINNRIVSKAVLISKVPIYGFLPHKGIHLCFCETIPEARGKGLYPLLLSYIQNDYPLCEFYMIVKEDNTPSIRGIEKAGFVKYAEGVKNEAGRFVVTHQMPQSKIRTK